MFAASQGVPINLWKFGNVYIFFPLSLPLSYSFFPI